MTENEKVVHAFYEAFKGRDAETMTKYYSDDVIFSDPAFGRLEGLEAKSMWKMLCESGKDLDIHFKIISTEKDQVRVHWTADYTFSKTGRRVHNEINAQLRLKENQIVEHIDTFDLHKWASQALGWKGKLIGGTSFFRKQLNSQTNKMLVRFMS